MFELFQCDELRFFNLIKDKSVRFIVTESNDYYDFSLGVSTVGSVLTFSMCQFKFDNLRYELESIID